MSLKGNEPTAVHKGSDIDIYVLRFKFWAKNRGGSLYTRPLLSEGVNWLVGGQKLN